MIRSLVGLPFRLGARWTGVAVHGTAEVAERAFGLVGLVSHALSGPREPEVDLDGSPHDGAASKRSGPASRPQPAPPAGAWSRTARAESSSVSQTADGPVPAAPAPAAPAPAPPAPAAPGAPPAPPSAPPPASPPPAALDAETPDHVSEEATLVGSVAEAGAEDGAGAQVNVAEPWDGYRQMKAGDVIERITGTSTAVLAAVELYERSGRARQSILAAVERELKHPRP